MRLSFLYGIPLGRWMGLLAENRFRIQPRYLGRALRITALSLLSSFFRIVEKITYPSQAAKTEIERAPLFVLGHWRTGTTHLHYLLAQDCRFAFPNVFETAFPDSFLLSQEKRIRQLEPLVKNKRPQDNIHVDMKSPSEDDMAMSVLAPRAFYNAWSFPQRFDHYLQGLDFQNVPPKELERWKVHHKAFHSRLFFRYKRPLLFKSPAHTCRIALLRAMYPGSRFVHITRHPYRVIQSNLHLFDVWSKNYAFLQEPDLDNLEERVLEVYRRMYDAFFAQQPQIPEGNYCHLRFEDLEKDPLGELEKIYEQLGLPTFEEVRPALVSYLASIADYKKNELPPMSDTSKARIYEALKRSFEAWGYEP